MSERKWGPRSKKVYATLDPDLQRLTDILLDEVADISLISGYRDAAEQNSLFDQGFSKLRYPDSKHNSYPAKAVDFQPYPYPQSERELWASLGYIAGAAIRIGRELGVTIRWGGDWNQNGQVSDETFHDLFHLEITDDTG